MVHACIFIMNDGTRITENTKFTSNIPLIRVKSLKYPYSTLRTLDAKRSPPLPCTMSTRTISEVRWQWFMLEATSLLVKFEHISSFKQYC